MAGQVDAVWLWSPVGIGGIGLVFAVLFYLWTVKRPEGTEPMNRIARYIREGAMAFLKREYLVLAGYAAVVFVLLTLKLGIGPGSAFLLGAFLSLLAGFFGMRAATLANVRTAEAARQGSKANALLTALDGGAVMGLSVAGLGLLGLSALFLGLKNGAQLGVYLEAFAVGASLSRSSPGSAAASTPKRRMSARISRGKSCRESPKTTPETPA